MFLSDEIEKLTDLLMDNYLLSSVIIIANDKVKDGTQISVSRRGNAFEHIGMLEDIKMKLLTGDLDV
jgi:hypothetical protein